MGTLLASLIILIVVGHVYLYLLLYSFIKKSKFYASLLKLHEQARKIPSKVKTKGDLRRARKYMPYARAFRGKLTKLMLLNLALFTVVYISMLSSTMYVSRILGLEFVETPIIIPFFTKITPEGKLYVHFLVIVLLALLLSVYPISRGTKVAD
jgi:hypothetical protein